MSDSDFDIIDFDLFVSRREVISTDPFIANGMAKLINIIETYQCFKDTQSPYVFKQNSNKPFYKNNITNKPIRKVKNLSYTERVKRETIALLNKLSESNFATISEKLMRFCEESNCKLLIEMILDKCVIQETYMHLFLRLINKLNDKHKNVIQAVIPQYIEEYLNTIEKTLDELNILDHTDYDKFCLFMLRKKALINKNTLLLSLKETCNIGDIHKRSYEAFSKQISKYIDNQDVLDVIVSVIVQIIKHRPKESRDIVDNMKTIYESCLKSKISCKSKFQILECIDGFGKVNV